MVPLTLRNFFTPVWHLAAFLHYLSLEKLRGVIFLSVEANISTIEIFFYLCMGFLPLPKFIIFFDEHTAPNVARGNLALGTESEGWERIQAGELRLHALVRKAQQKER